MCGAEGLRVRRGMIDALCSLEEEGEKRPRAQRQALTTAEKRGEGEGTDKKG